VMIDPEISMLILWEVENLNKEWIIVETSRAILVQRR
jgi:hypothetical protein